MTPEWEKTVERSGDGMPQIRFREQTKTARGGFAIQQTSSPDLRVTDIDLQKPANSLSVATAQNGDTISVHYVGKFPGGKVFDTSMRSEAEKSGLFNPARDY